MKVRFYIMMVLVLSLLWIIWLAPASLLLSATEPDTVQMNNLQGSIWDGTAARLSIDTAGFQLQAERLRWKFDPLALLGGRFCLYFEAALMGAPSVTDGVSGRLCAHPDRHISLTGIQVDLPAALVIRDAGFDMEGHISLELDQLDIDSDQQVSELRGRGFWSDAALIVPAVSGLSRLTVGSAAIELSSVADGGVLIVANNQHEQDADAFDLQVSVPAQQPQNYRVHKLVLGDQLVSDSP